MNRPELNKFKREHFQLTKRIIPNAIIHDPNTTKEHRRLVIEICEWAKVHNLTFYTRAFLKNGKNVDVVIPDLPKPFIEIRNSEEKKYKEYLADQKLITQFVDVSNPYKLL